VTWLLIAAGVGAGLIVLPELLRAWHRSELAKLQPKDGGIPVPASDGAVETLRFLYTQRLTLFNERRDYEWKVYFAVIALFGGADAALLTQPVDLTEEQKVWWVLLCVAAALLSLHFEYHLQLANGKDRSAMNALYNTICDGVRIHPLSPAREKLLCGRNRSCGGPSSVGSASSSSWRPSRR